MYFPEIETTFLPLHSGDGGENLRRSAGAFPQSCGRTGRRIRPGAHRSDLLCSRLDAAFEGSADHTRGCDLTVATGEHRPAWRRHSRLAWSRINPRLNRYSNALRHTTGLPDDAAQGRRDAPAISRQLHKKERALVELSEIPRDNTQALLRQP